MIRISQIKLPCGHTKNDLDQKIRKILRGRDFRMPYSITRHSVDARKKPALFDIYTVDVDTGKTPAEEQKLVRRLRNHNVTAVEPVRYHFPKAAPGARRLCERPVIIGAGPAGLFCALLLSGHGYRPVIFERGKKMEERRRDVEQFWTSGKLDLSSNVQFGEGGAGTFSDGKLNTLVRDKNGRQTFVLRTFADCGAPENILYESHPHIGTDRLRTVIPCLRRQIEQAGGEFRFETAVTGLDIQDGRVRGVFFETDDPGRGKVTGHLAADCVVLAPGHSARDTISELFRQQVPMEQKNFAIGLRVSHPQALINRSQYGTDDPGEMERLGLEPANYKLTSRASSGRGVYSFCMCPGGYIVNASSEEGMTAVNGMSDMARDSGRANSAIVVTVGSHEFGSGHPLAGMAFQRALEKKCWELGHGAVPYEWFCDFESGFAGEESPGRERRGQKFPEHKFSSEELCIRGQAVQAPLHNLLPKDLTSDFIEGMRHFDHVIPGFAGDKAFVAGIESRTSSPVRIVRDSATLQSPVQGLFPCGEGAGYAGGIMSAAMDGMKVAEAVAQEALPSEDSDA